MLVTIPPETDLSQYRGHPVELESFQGPLDLLLHLIKKDRIEIWEISVSRITSQYLEYLSTLRSLNIEVAGEFLVMAATLMRIKSQNLLPRPSVGADADEEEEPLTREGLIARLAEYRRVREAARAMGEMEWSQGRKHPRGAAAALGPGFTYPLREPRLLDLTEYLRLLLAKKEEEVPAHNVRLEDIRLEDQMDWVDAVLREAQAGGDRPESEGQGLPFRRLLRRPGFRLEVVVTFLAILELARLQRLYLLQPEAMAEIWILAREMQAVPDVLENAAEELT